MTEATGNIPIPIQRRSRSTQAAAARTRLGALPLPGEEPHPTRTTPRQAAVFLPVAMIVAFVYFLVPLTMFMRSVLIDRVNATVAAMSLIALGVLGLRALLLAIAGEVEGPSFNAPRAGGVHRTGVRRLQRVK